MLASCMSVTLEICYENRPLSVVSFIQTTNRPLSRSGHFSPYLEIDGALTALGFIDKNT